MVRRRIHTHVYDTVTLELNCTRTLTLENFCIASVATY
jgi:hypothetical protein